MNDRAHAGERESADARTVEAHRERSVYDGPSAIHWDLVGGCNLRCPACAAGARTAKNASGRINDAAFRRILAILTDAFRCRQLHFYNWAEPLLHPRIVGCCEEAVAAGFHVHLSSNLNHLPDPPGVMASGLKTFRISLSGYSQEVYRIGHRGGDVERVKDNMRRLSAAREKVGSRTRVHVYYLKYRHNLIELERARGFAGSLGFEFHHDWAFYTPLERILAYVDGSLSEAEKRTADQLLAPDVLSALSVVRPHRARPCPAIDQLVLNLRGDVMLCCALFDETSAKVGNILELDWPRLQALRYGHPICSRCTRAGAHVLYTHYQDQALRTAMERLAETRVDRVGSCVGRAAAGETECGACREAGGKGV